MKVKGDTIIFESDSWETFYKEEKGLKQNIVQILDYRESLQLLKLQESTKLRKIRILYIKDVIIQSFERELTDISYIGSLVDKMIYVFSWRHMDD